MPVDLKLLKRAINPCPGFLLTRDQTERMQGLVGEAIEEIHRLREENAHLREEVNHNASLARAEQVRRQELERNIQREVLR